MDWLKRLLHWHRWTMQGELRRCELCGRVERLEPDVGGWTAGNWDPVDPSEWDETKPL